MSERVGKSVECAVCHKMKKPLGRSAPLEMGNSLCHYDCPGYLQDPQPDTLWPGEKQEGEAP